MTKADLRAHLTWSAISERDTVKTSLLLLVSDHERDFAAKISLNPWNSAERLEKSTTVWVRSWRGDHAVSAEETGCWHGARTRRGQTLPLSTHADTPRASGWRAGMAGCMV